MLFVLMASLSAQMVTHVVNLLLVSMAAVHFQMLFVVVMESIAAQMDTRVMFQLERVVKESRQPEC